MRFSSVRFLVICTLFLATGVALIAQDEIILDASKVGISNHGADPDPSSILDISATNKGILIPRVNIKEMVNSPAPGLLIYENSSKRFWYFDGVEWVQHHSAFVEEDNLIYNHGSKTADFIIGQDTLPDNNTFATMLLFDNSKTALRVGRTGQGAFNPDSLGTFSIAVGERNIAKGAYSSSFGELCQSRGIASFSAGRLSESLGDYAVSFGNNNESIGDNSFSMGSLNKAEGDNSFALGNSTNASGENAVSLGNLTDAKSLNAFAVGSNTEVKGDNAAAFGFGTEANAYGSLVIGYNNKEVVATPETSITTGSPLLIIGNGTGGFTRSNALVVRNDGSVEINEAFTLPTADGSSGEILGTDGSGQVSWVTASGDDLGSHTATTHILMSNNKVRDLGPPTADNDAARKKYVDNHEDGDSDSSNELITSLSMNGNDLEILENGVTHSLNIGGAAVGFENNLGVLRNIGNNNTDDFVFGNDELPTSLPITETLFFFDQGKSAFRAGNVAVSNAWQPSLLGTSSFGAGRNVEASGEYSVALGYGSIASGDYAFSHGQNAKSLGLSSISLGNNAEAIVLNCIAIGNTAKAEGTHSVAVGFDAYANGFRSISFGGDAIGSHARSFSTNGSAHGYYSNCMGYNTQSNGYASLVVGRYNDTIVAAQNLITGATPLFIIGNGLTNTNRSNAVVVYNSGNVEFNKDILPMTDNFSDLGSLSKRFNTVFASNGTIQTSDRRAKKNIANLSYGLEEVLQLNPIDYHWNHEGEKDKKHIGIMAQELLEVMPELVHEPEMAEELLGVKYAELAPVLINAIQSLNLKIVELENEVAYYKNQNQELDHRLSMIEKQLSVNKTTGVDE